MKQPKIVRAIHANRGVEAAYSKALRAIIEEMNASVEYWMAAAYRKTPPAMAAVVETAQDAVPSRAIMKVLKSLGKRWIDKFNDHAPLLAEAYVTRMYKASDSAFRAALKDAGWSVEFKMTPAMRDSLNSMIGENIALIKSIPEQYLNQVEGAVMRSYSVGRDLESMVKEIKSIYPVTDRRAILIARDQSNKANAVVNRTRQLELGLTDAVWMHSHAGKNPRPAHVAANGKRYKIADGCLIDGKLIQPGELISCRCSCKVVLPE